MRPTNSDSSFGMAIAAQAQDLAFQALENFAKSKTSLAQLHQVFGQDLSIKRAEELLAQWSNGNFSSLPTTKILSSNVIPMGNGAFSSTTNTIYLSRSFAQRAIEQDDLTGVTGVLIEEVGHFIDSQLNTRDTAGDEGELFSAFVQDKSLTPQDFLRVATEDDTATILLNGVVTPIEMSQIPMAVVQNQLYQVHRGRANEIYWRSSSNGTNWSNWQQIPDLSTPNAPAIAEFYGKLYVAHRGMNNRVYTDVFDGQRWERIQEDFSSSTPDAPAMVVFRRRLYQAHRGTDNGIYIRYSAEGSPTSWSRWQRLNGTTPDAPALTTFYNGSGENLYIAHRGMNNRIYTGTFKDSLEISWQEDTIGRTPDAPAMGVFTRGSDSLLYQAHRGMGNRIHVRSSADGINWTSWETQVGLTLSAPFMQDFQGKFYQTHQGTNDVIYTRSSNDAEDWTKPESAWLDSQGLTPVDRDDATSQPGIPLHSKPSTVDPLMGFRDPLSGKGTISRGSHPDPRGRFAIDIAAGMETPVYAMASGTVVSLRSTTPDLRRGQKGTIDNANFVLIKLDDSDGIDDGYRALYLHLQQNSVTVRPGQRVNAGDLIGRVGHNGISTGPHLHVEINRPHRNQYGQSVPFKIEGR